MTLASTVNGPTVGLPRFGGRPKMGGSSPRRMFTRWSKRCSNDDAGGRSRQASRRRWWNSARKGDTRARTELDILAVEARQLGQVQAGLGRQQEQGVVASPSRVAWPASPGSPPAQAAREG